MITTVAVPRVSTAEGVTVGDEGGAAFAVRPVAREGAVAFTGSTWTAVGRGAAVTVGGSKGSGVIVTRAVGDEPGVVAAEAWERNVSEWPD